MFSRNLVRFTLSISFFVSLLFTSLLFTSLIMISPVFATSQLQESLQNNQFNFIKNQGQRNENVAYYTRALDGAVFVTKKGELVYSLPKKTEHGTANWSFKETFKSQKGLSIDQSNEKQFVSELPLGQLTSDIHVKLKSEKNNVEKLFYLSAGADVANIKVLLEGINGSHINKLGQLVLETGLGPVTFTKPVAFQMQAIRKN